MVSTRLLVVVNQLTSERSDNLQNAAQNSSIVASKEFVFKLIVRTINNCLTNFGDQPDNEVLVMNCEKCGCEQFFCLDQMMNVSLGVMHAGVAVTIFNKSSK